MLAAGIAKSEFVLIPNKALKGTRRAGWGLKTWKRRHLPKLPFLSPLSAVGRQLSRAPHSGVQQVAEVRDAGYGQVALHSASSNRFVKMSGHAPCSNLSCDRAQMQGFRRVSCSLSNTVVIFSSSVAYPRSARGKMFRGMRLPL